jgi:hypothetical protein
VELIFIFIGMNLPIDRRWQRTTNFPGWLLKQGIAAIGAFAFSTCESLAPITLPAGLTIIGTGAFNWCNSLSVITVPALKPPVLSGSLWFLEGDESPPAVIYVPAASLAAYKNAPGWEDYADRIRAMRN